ncbi:MULTISPECIES: RNA 2',3'-cyclic phosphodiesterase [unclassified Methylophaga]|jgi:2'-5' RNA ligase|uniref:RNA 2',3'-cyclic phosphodiesterase n=1 Tax=unclassified Methylophaga TaxID=2629249 RepID=UPI000C997CFE|nr:MULTISPECIES: RNA 2',3'-cyclic phosphodiesterase [unclassified Methylophaga]MAK66396.1 RNA 2',3'-cyclic phosphodiesterase [Methylophaga sp.]MAY17090.1 RNA 2',3'-cyclic phosphodiesterase [Methylophaga sp.]MBN46121.1 RNA 2',3'-cyclic phosphodiesterase [Methylophaga sp.]HAO25927.1 RNA 2',3'-cyclic phosphodiesterase [Methylophaga sp.]HCD05025.1 RNA 2',3'-cyclic phosphodiesterase [Methylophaga sp.]|tara:strand:- start:32299 stop:32847 length:549 start_codon:yes stop_codon:yes gene_type:complete
MNLKQNRELTPGRYFFALSPDLNSRMQIQHIMKRLPDDPSLKLQTTDNLHQTLLFLGQLDQQQINALLKHVDSIRCPAIDMQFDLVSYWETPGIFCLTSRTPRAVLFDLVSKLEQIAREAEIKVDERPYQPHITLARKASGAVSVPIAPVCFKAEQLVLMKSVSTEQGPQYQPIMHWPITAA